jgi:hypothetical protein
MTFLQANWIIAFVCAFILYGAGKKDLTVRGSEDRSILWAALSIAVSALVIQVFAAGVVHVLLAQAALFVGIGVFRALKDR